MSEVVRRQEEVALEGEGGEWGRAREDVWCEVEQGKGKVT